MSYLSRFLTGVDKAITASVQDLRERHNQRFDLGVAEARLRTASKYPRCDCKGNQRTAIEWKKLAKTDIVAFLKLMFGTTIEKMTTEDKVALRRYCPPFLTSTQNAMLKSLNGRPSKDFWARFIHTTDTKFHAKITHTDDSEFTMQESLVFLSKMFNPKAKKLSDIKLSPTQRTALKANVLLLSKLPLEVREQLGVLYDRRGTNSKKKLPLNKKMTLQDTEKMISRGLSDAVMDPQTQRLVFKVNARQRWRYLATRYESKLCDEFLRKYSLDLNRRVGGRKPLELDENLRAVRVQKVKKAKPMPPPSAVRLPADKKPPVKLTLKTKQPSKPAKTRKHDDELDLDMDMKDLGLVRKLTTQQPSNQRHRDDYDESLNDPLDFTHEQVPEIPNTRITTRESLNQFINAIMKRHDRSYPLSLTPSDWGYAEWLLVDSYKDSIEPRLIQLYQPQINEALRRMNSKTGGAYASIRSSRNLAVAYIVTSRMTGDI